MSRLDGVHVYDPDVSPKNETAKGIKTQISRPENGSTASWAGESIFDFDWGKDILESPKPPEVIESFSPLEEDRLVFGYDRKTYTYVQADPRDKLRFLEPVAGTKEHYVNKQIWQNTLDRYLEHYYRLVKRKAGTLYQTSEMHEVLTGRLERYYDAASDRQKPIPPVVKRTVFLDKSIVDEQSRNYAMISHMGKAYLNQACRWLFTKDKALHSTSLFYDGLPLRVKVKTEEGTKCIALVEDFSICDYMDHEMLTGISLSIEITAVLREFLDKSLQERALAAFEKTALPRVVKSRQLFTRISAARNFFQQFLMEQNTDYYRWTTSIRSDRISEEEWDAMVLRAGRHLDILESRPMGLDVPEEETDRAIAHLEHLLSKVEVPVNLPKYAKAPEHGLAAFCNRNHYKIASFLDDLKDKDAERITQIPRRRSEAHILFQRVRAMVKMAIGKALEEALKAQEGGSE